MLFSDSFFHSISFVTFCYFFQLVSSISSSTSFFLTNSSRGYYFRWRIRVNSHLSSLFTSRFLILFTNFFYSFFKHSMFYFRILRHFIKAVGVTFLFHYWIKFLFFPMSHWSSSLIYSLFFYSFIPHWTISLLILHIIHIFRGVFELRSLFSDPVLFPFHFLDYCLSFSSNSSSMLILKLILKRSILSNLLFLLQKWKLLRTFHSSIVPVNLFYALLYFVNIIKLRNYFSANNI